MIVDGTMIASDIYATLLARRGALPAELALGVVVCAPDAVTDSFVRIKSRAAERLGVRIVRADVPRERGTAGILDAIRALTAQTHGIVVQLPLPHDIDTDAVLAALPATHDVDGISASARVIPPVARAVSDTLVRHGIRLAGSRAVVVGAGRLVGAPVARALAAAGATVAVITKDRGSLADLADADIVVSGAGEPGLITPSMLREGAVLIDAGTSEQGGKVRGDADPACAGHCALFTPVPGGIGPIAVAMLFANLFDLAAVHS